MKKHLLIISIAASTLFVACSGGGANNTANTPTNGTTNGANNAATSKATPTIDPNMQATFPFKDFPTVDTTAKAGEVVLVPSYNWLQEANVKGADKTTMIWYSQTMVTPGAEMSDVKFMSDTKKVPNAYIVAIPAGQTAKKAIIW